MLLNYSAMLSTVQKLDAKINKIKQQLKHYPPGKIFCTRNGKYYKWYHSDGHNQTYIPKKKRSYAEKLAVKKYLSALLTDLMREKKASNLYLKYYPQKSESEKLLSEMSEYHELLSPYFTPLSQVLTEWMNEPFEANPNHPETLTIKTITNHLVRSKSESIIDLCLYSHKIPFRYEAPLVLDGVTFYPDFTIRHPITGDFYYWEHFGLMDNPEYCEHAFSKLKFYTRNGLIPSIHIITTYETKEHPLSPETVENLIQTYFL